MFTVYRSELSALVTYQLLSSTSYHKPDGPVICDELVRFGLGDGVNLNLICGCLFRGTKHENHIAFKRAVYGLF